MTEETKEEIQHVTKKELSRKICQLRKEYRDDISELHIYVSNLSTQFNNALIAINKSISGHSKGVQNVYDEVKAIKDLYNITTQDTVIFNKIVKLKEIIEKARLTDM